MYMINGMYDRLRNYKSAYSAALLLAHILRLVTVSVHRTHVCVIQCKLPECVFNCFGRCIQVECDYGGPCTGAHAITCRDDGL